MVLGSGKFFRVLFHYLLPSRRWAVALFGIFLFLSNTSAQLVDATATYSRDTIFPGDTVQLQLKITLNDGEIEEILLDSNSIFQLAGLKALDIVSTGSWNKDAAFRGRLSIADKSLSWDRSSSTGLSSQVNTITAVFWRPGNYYAPGFQLVRSTATGRDTFRFSPFQFNTQLTVLTPMLNPAMLETNDSLQLAVIKPILQEPFKIQDAIRYLWIYLLLAALLFGIYYFFWRKEKEGPAPAFMDKEIPPHLLALAKLKRLQKGKLLENEGPKAYYSELTYILREYLEKQFTMPALEATSSEILREMNGDQRFSEQLQGLRHTFELADAVKFAKARPPEDRHKEAYSVIEHFVIATAPKEDENQEEGKTTVPSVYPASDWAFKNESLAPAKPLRRLAAVLSDLFLLFAVFFPIIMQTPLWRGESTGSTFFFQLALVSSGLILAGFLLSTFMVSRWGGTPGKLIFGIEVRDEEGKRLSFSHASRRFFAKLVLGLFLNGFAFLPLLFNTQRKALYDRLAGTVVVRVSKKENPLLDSLDQQEME
jgi:uncharacterized RDD family membrane protein YckC